MRKSIVILVSAVVGATALAPSAYARHRRIHHVAVAPVANPRIDASGQFYATPISATGVGVPGLDVIPGVGLAFGVANGVANPIVGPGGIAPAIVAPGADAAEKIVDPLFAPLAQITPPT